MPDLGEEWSIDLSTPGGRADADQYLADCGQVLERFTAELAAEVSAARARGVDETGIALHLIAESQNDPRADLPQLVALAGYRLACQRINEPESWGFNAHPLDDGRYKVTLTLAREAIDSGQPRWKQMRAIAYQVLKAAAIEEAQERQAATVGVCAQCGSDFTPITGFEMRPTGTVCGPCARGENNR